MVAAPASSPHGNGQLHGRSCHARSLGLGTGKARHVLDARPRICAGCGGGDRTWESGSRAAQPTGPLPRRPAILSLRPRRIAWRCLGRRRLALISGRIPLVSRKLFPVVPVWLGRWRSTSVRPWLLGSDVARHPDGRVKWAAACVTWGQAGPARGGDGAGRQPPAVERPAAGGGRTTPAAAALAGLASDSASLGGLRCGDGAGPAHPGLALGPALRRAGSGPPALGTGGRGRLVGACRASRIRRRARVHRAEAQAARDPHPVRPAERRHHRGDGAGGHRLRVFRPDRRLARHLGRGRDRARTGVAEHAVGRVLRHRGGIGEALCGR